MAVFGWIVLAAFTGVVCLITFLIGMAMLSLKGKPDGEFYAFAAVSAGLVYISVRTFPFIVQVAP